MPWGIAFLPDGDALVAERDSGRIVRIPAGGGKPRRVMTVPGVAAGGEGGLLGLAVSPRYARDRYVYAYLTAASDNRIVRFRLGGSVRNVLTGLQKSGIHNGGRIHFGPDGKLYAGVGDAANTGNSQDPGSRNGKILRMDPSGANARVWTLGHRNVQGFAWDRAGRMWASEFGQNTFDEVNLIRRGRNYGWPEVEGRGDTRRRTLHEPARDMVDRGRVAVGRGDHRLEPVRGRVARRMRVADPDPRHVAGHAAADALGPLRPHPHGRGGTRRDALGGDVEP